MTVLVTGATGTTGSRVTRHLSARGVAVRRAGRSSQADVRFDWDDPATFAPALRGIRAVYLVAPLGVADPEPVVVRFLAEARRAGVERLALLSSSAIPIGSDGPGRLGARLPEFVPRWAVLQPTWFASNFTGDHAHASSVRAADEIVSATGDGRIPFIDPDDIAAVACEMLTDAGTPQGGLVLTGPQPLTFDEVAVALSGFTGRTVHHRRLGRAQVAARHQHHGVPADFADLLAGMDEAIARGAEDRVTDTVETVTGRPPRSFHDFLAAQPRDALSPPADRRAAEGRSTRRTPPGHASGAPGSSARQRPAPPPVNTRRETSGTGTNADERRPSSP